MSDLVLHLEGEAPPAPAAPRTPHLGHAAFFLIFALGTVTITQLVAVGIAHLMPQFHDLRMQEILQLPKITVISSLVAYALILMLARLFFPTVWHRSFASGISWNSSTASRNWKRLIPAGIAIALISAVSESLFSIPKDLPVDKFFNSQADLWLVTVLGTLLAPAFEEICFRGFLLPAIAIAWDWLALPRTPEARLQWHATDTISAKALTAGAILSSIAFVAMHGPQLHWTHGPLAVLFLVSLIFSAIRIRLKSVAASSLVHASYNGFLFVITFISTSGYTHLDKLSR